MLSFDDFVKVFNAYGKYVSQAPTPAQQAPTPAQQAPTPAQQAPTPAQQAPQDGITQMLTQMQAQLNQMLTPAPSIDGIKSLSVDDVIAKIFD